MSVVSVAEKPVVANLVFHESSDYSTACVASTDCVTLASQAFKSSPDIEPNSADFDGPVFAERPGTAAQ